MNKMLFGGHTSIMNNKKVKIQASEDLIFKIAQCISDAVGDDIKENSYRLPTQNGTPGRIWDLIHRNVINTFNLDDIIAKPTKRGGWGLVPIFDKKTGFIYTLMREKRFEEIKKELPNRRNANYTDALANHLNKNLLPAERQILLFPGKKKFENQKYIENIVEKIFNDLSIPDQIVKRHAIILFDSSHYELLSLRCCVVNSNLEIVASANWSKYIKHSESTIVDKVVDNTSPFNNPSANLSFTQKAKDKKGQKKTSKIKSDTEDSQKKNE